MSHLRGWIIVPTPVPMWTVTTVLSFSFDLLQLSSFIMLGPYGKMEIFMGKRKTQSGRAEPVRINQCNVELFLSLIPWSNNSNYVVIVTLIVIKM